MARCSVFVRRAAPTDQRWALRMISTPLYPLKRAHVYARQRAVAHTSSSRAWTTRLVHVSNRESCVCLVLSTAAATLQDELDVFDD